MIYYIQLTIISCFRSYLSDKTATFVQKTDIKIAQ